MADNKRFGMVIDTTVCVGCQTCAVSCNVSHELPSDVLWSHVVSFDGNEVYQPTGTFPAPVLKFRPTLCNHCDNPACVAACPTGAMVKDPETGIVSPDAEVCIGCGSCVSACPRHQRGDVHLHQVHLLQGALRQGPGAFLRGGLPCKRPRIRRLERPRLRSRQACGCRRRALAA